MQINKFCLKINFAENQFHWKSTSRKNQFHWNSISRKNQFQENINFAEKSISRKNQDCFRETLIVFSVAICFHDFFAKIIQIFIKLIFTRNWWSVKVNFREIEIQRLPFLKKFISVKFISWWNRFLIKRFAINLLSMKLDFREIEYFWVLLKHCARQILYTRLLPSVPSKRSRNAALGMSSSIFQDFISSNTKAHRRLQQFLCRVAQFRYFLYPKFRYRKLSI